MSAHKNRIYTSDFIIITLLILSVILEYLFPSNLFIDRIFSVILGVVILLGTWTLIFVSKYQFRAYGQKTGPGNETTKLITTGLLDYSRNPIYLGVIFILPAFGFIFDSLWLLSTIIPCFIMLQKMLIVPEEKYLAEKFGEEYLEYCRKVGRWI